MDSLEEKLKQIYQKIDNEEETISLKEVHELFSQAKKECDKEEGKATEDDKEQMVLVIMKFFNFNARAAAK
jgi:hypothetical protein